MNYQILSWDSDFLGVKVARINEPVLTMEELAETLSELKHKTVKVVYWPSRREYNDDEAGRLGGQLVDKKTTFAIDLRQFAKDDRISSDPVEPYSPSMPVSDLEDLAIQSGEYSRFAADPHFPREKFVELYKTWIRRSLSKEVLSDVLVIREASRVVGMVALGEKGGRGEIALLAVDSGFRGKGFGEALTMAAQQWFLKNGFAFGQVTTQGRNVSACNLYAKCGYEIERVEYFYHFWL